MGARSQVIHPRVIDTDRVRGQRAGSELTRARGVTRRHAARVALCFVPEVRGHYFLATRSQIDRFSIIAHSLKVPVQSPSSSLVRVTCASYTAHKQTREREVKLF